jgi:hypothetical protein
LYKVDGGWSYMMRLFVERILYGPSGMSTVGVPLLIGGQERILFAKLTNLLSDGDGHRMGWDWRGAASLKPCWKHFNVFRKDSGLAHRMPGYVEIDCSDPALLRSWTASEVYFAADSVAAAAAKVAAGTMTKGDFQEHEKTQTNTNNTNNQTHRHNTNTTKQPQIQKMLEELEKSVGINNGNGMLMSKLLRCCAVARPCVISLCDLVAVPL